MELVHMNNCRLLDIKTVPGCTQYHATLYRQIKAGLFPEPVRIGTRRGGMAYGGYPPRITVAAHRC